MTDLRKAAEAVLERWDSPAWEWKKQGPTADLMASLRTALAAEPTKPEPVAWQERHFFPRVGEWTGWDDCRPIMADYPREQIDQNGVRYQWRPLYTAPPEDEALRRDAERYRWLQDAGQKYWMEFADMTAEATEAAIDAAMEEKR